MKAIIGNSLISSLKPKDKEYDIWDKKLTGFILRVQPNGKMVYRCEYARGKRFTIGKSTVLTPAQARDRAKQILGDAAKGIALIIADKKSSVMTLKKFIEQDYHHWVKAHRKSGAETIARIKLNFFDQFGSKPLSEITPLAIEKWRSTRLKNGIAAVTANRDIAALKGVL